MQCKLLDSECEPVYSQGPHVTLRASVCLATWPLTEAVTILTARQAEWGCLGHHGGRLG